MKGPAAAELVGFGLEARAGYTVPFDLEKRCPQFYRSSLYNKCRSTAAPVLSARRVCCSSPRAPLTQGARQMQYQREMLI